MPRIVSYTPQWLMRPSPGYEMFAPKGPPQAPPTNVQPQLQPPVKQKTVASRGSEIFVAVGTEIRWADLAALQEKTASYQTLKLSVPHPITQLVISPHGDYLAVTTQHTVHIVVIPDSSFLDSDKNIPIKPKTFQVGPTAHVKEESALASVLWHPLGYHGRCLVTVTREAVVRLWEINRSDRSSFGEPTLSIDLKKLANATSDQEDLSASKFGAAKGFSPDSIELEVASACFGDFPEQEGVHGWAPTTLWIAMREGDLYALCPLLPSKWQLLDTPGASAFLGTLATSINTDLAENEEDDSLPADMVEISHKQLAWFSDIIYQEPYNEKLPNGDSIRVFSRPNSVPATPLLQGPFTLSPSTIDDFEIADIIVFSLKSFSSGTEDEPAEGLPAAVICLLTDTTKIHVCLDLEGVVGRWLPSTTNESSLYGSDEHPLPVVETIELTDDDTSSSLSHCITADVHTDFSFFVSHEHGVFYISLEKWIRNVESELAEPQSEGVEFRLTRQLESASSQVELCMPRPTKHASALHVPEDQVTACVVIEDGNIGYLLLTANGSEPQAVTLDAPEDGVPTREELEECMNVGSLPLQTRPAYQAPRELWEPLHILGSIDQLVPSRHSAASKQEIRLSPANLDILMNVHKVLSQDTYKLQAAVSDLFRRSERLLDEFRDQGFRTAQLATKIDSVTGNSESRPEGGSEKYGSAKIEERLQGVVARQEAIGARYERIRRKMVNIGGSELSEKESGLVEELQAMERSLDKTAQTLTDDADGSEVPSWQRVENVRGLKRELTRQAENMSNGGEQGPQRAAGGVKVPSHSRKQENEQIEALLQRETALVEAATNRLRSMGISIPLEGGS